MDKGAARRGLLLVGGGKMGSALVEGWLEQGLAGADITVVEPDVAQALLLVDRLGVRVVNGNEDLVGSAPEVVVFAVKPQVMGDVMPPYVRFVHPDTVFLSIAAGRNIASFERVLGEAAAIVRAMPNTPAAVRRGITVACPNVRVTQCQITRCQQLLEAVGEVAWIDDESLMDAVTGVSGSGPAYVFLLTECLAAAGVVAGLPEDLAARLARATVAGSGELMRRSADAPDILRRNVTSPGGTTAAALDVLMAKGPEGLPELLNKAVSAATQRGRYLAK